VEAEGGVGVNIYAKHGDKVRFAHPNNGYRQHQEVAARHLTVGATYTVDRMEAEYWHSGVYLVEVPGVLFNTVLFDNEGRSSL
jgi:hypothetical protein